MSLLWKLRGVLKDAVFDRKEAQFLAERERLGHLRGFPPALWNAGINDAGHLTIGGLDCVELAAQFGTPLHVVHHARLKQDFLGFRGAFAAHWPRVELGCSYKTNPLPGVLQCLHELGAFAEVISHFELWLARRLGVPGERIIFNGPAKTREALELAVSIGGTLVNIDGLHEIDYLAQLMPPGGARQRVGVRVVASVGWSGQFGLSIANGQAMEAFRRIRDIAHLKPVGLHIHLGTGIKDIPTYLRAVGEVLEFSVRLRRELGIDIEVLDLGGGFGVPTVRPYDVWDARMMQTGRGIRTTDPSLTPKPADYADVIVPLVRQHYDPQAANAPTLVFEPGRAITSSAQLLLLKVLAVKQSPQTPPRIILDGGKNLAIPLGYEFHEVLPASRMRDPCTDAASLYGPLCHPGDTLYTSKRFPAVQAGDVVAIMDAGAYFIPNQMNFSNPRAAVVMVREGKASLIRARESYDDIVRLDVTATAPPPHG